MSGDPGLENRMGRAEAAFAAFLLLIALFLRLYDLSGSPPGLFRDEAEKGYTAYELAMTGRHAVPGAGGQMLVSRPLPLFIEVYEGHDRTSAIYQYLSAPIVRMAGLGVGSIRCVAALGGWLGCLAFWLVARRLGGTAAGLTTLALLCFQPTGVLFSRWAQQGILLLPLAGFAILAFLRSLEPEDRNRRAWSLASGLLFGLAAYAYDPARLVVPLLVGALVLINGGSIRRDWRTHAPGLALLGLIVGALIVYTLTAGSSRLGRVGIWSEGPAAGAWLFVRNYASHFDPSFLVISGDANPRHHLPACGFMGWGGGILLGAGLLAAISAVRGDDPARRRAALVGLFFLLVAPVAASLTREGVPHALRANLMIPAAALLGGLSVPWQVRIAAGKLPIPLMIGLLCIMELGQALVGVGRLSRSAPGPWEGGLQPALQQALAGPGRVHLSAEFPYANFHALFAECPDPAVYAEQGLGALRTQMVPPGQTPALQPGDVFIAPPRTGLPLEMFNEYAVVYTMTDEGLIAEGSSSNN